MVAGMVMGSEEKNRKTGLKRGSTGAYFLALNSFYLWLVIGKWDHLFSVWWRCSYINSCST
jgi:hypothetical protein